MSRLVFLLVYRRKINLFCLLVKRTLKPLTSGEVARFTVTERVIHPPYLHKKTRRFSRRVFLFMVFD